MYWSAHERLQRADLSGENAELLLIASVEADWPLLPPASRRIANPMGLQIYATWRWGQARIASAASSAANAPRLRSAPT